MEPTPAVSVVMPVRDEADHLRAAVAAVLGQDWPELEIVLAVAPSGDGTEQVARDLAAADDRVRVVPNPAGGTAAGLNAAIDVARGDVIVRVDGHAQLSDGYVRRAVATLQATGADNVGGIQRAIGDAPMQQAVAAAMTSRFGTGDAKFHYGGEPGETDTVYLGVFRRDALERVGGFDESLVRNQDYELNWRLRESGGVVWFDPELSATYHPRSSLADLASQYFQYGQWKRVVISRAPDSMRWRHLVAPVTVLGNIIGLVVGLLRWRAALLAPLTYLTATLVVAVTTTAPWRVRLRLPAVFATMHHAWGLGFLRGTADPTRRTGRTGTRQVDAT